MKKCMLIVSAAIMLTACNSEEINIDEQIAARISATIGKSITSRACDENWERGDEIGITMGDIYINRKYTTISGDGSFTGTSMYFRNKNDKLTVSAYYPYSGDEGTSPSIVESSTGFDRQTLAEQPKFDFLYARLDEVSGSAPNINLAFKHQMSKLTLIFKNGNDGTDVSKINSYRIDGLVIDGTFNTVTGECVAKNTSATPIEMSPAVEHDVELPYLILFPQTVGKVTLRIADNEGQEYSCELKFTVVWFVSGNN